MIAGIQREAVMEAIAECDRSGRDAFLSWHGFGRGSAFTMLHDGQPYDPKAIVGVAAAYQFGGEPLRPSEFSGGLEHSARVLVRLGFDVRRGRDRLTVGDVAIPSRLSLRPADLRLYVTRPTSAKSVAACYEHGFGALLSPISVRKSGKVDDLSGHVKPLDGLPFVVDNGVWPCHENRVEWSDEPLLRLLARLDRENREPGFVVAPDIVGGGLDSLAFSLGWLTRHRDVGRPRRWMLAVQDGMSVDVVRQAVLEHELAGVFVGGSTEWKWDTAHVWSQLGLELGCRVHVGRVNTLHRAELCRDLGVSSIDGRSVAMFSINAPKMARPCDGVDRPASEVEPLRRRAESTIADRKFRLALGGKP